MLSSDGTDFENRLTLHFKGTDIRENFENLGWFWSYSLLCREFQVIDCENV